jgi:hypothetical protein
MSSPALLAQLPVSAASDAARAVVPDPDFDKRWAGWVARGLAHDQRVRRRFLICCPVIAIGVAIALALFGR